MSEDNADYVSGLFDMYRRLNCMFTHRGRLFCFYEQWNVLNDVVQHMNKLFTRWFLITIFACGPS